MTYLKRVIVPAMLAAWMTVAAMAADQGAAQGPNPRFYEVTKRLDAGGSFYMYADLKDVLKNSIASLQPALSAATPQAGQLFPKIDQALDELGVYGIQDVGISSKPDGNLYLNKCFISMPGGVKGLPAVLGNGPHKIESLAYAPASTMYYFQTDLNFDQLLGTIRTVAAQINGPQGVEQVNQVLAMMNVQLNVNVELLIKSLGNRVTVIIDQDPQQMMSLGPEAYAQVKALRAAVIISVKDDTLYKLLNQKAMMFNLAAPEQKGQNGLSVTTLNIPPNPQYKMTPIIVGSPDFVIVSTHTELVSAMMKASKNGGLNSNPEFRQLSAGLPTDGNGMMFISKDFFVAWRQIASILDRRSGKRNDAMDAFMKSNLMGQNGVYVIRRHEPNGIMLTSRASAGGLQAIAGLTAAPMLVPAIAVPNFFEARNRARSQAQGQTQPQSHVGRVQADLRSVSVAIEAYALDCSAYPAWSANPQENMFGQYVGQAPQLAGVPTFHVHGEKLYTLTTPIPYMPAMPGDPYAPAKGATYAFYSMKPAGWIVWSPGPDGKYDLNAANIQQAYQPSPMPSQMLMGLTYDPTNGANSTGDIWRIKNK